MPSDVTSVQAEANQTPLVEPPSIKLIVRLFLIPLIIFIVQNLNDAPIYFLGLNGQVSIGLALLLAGVCGLIIAAVPASARIWQLRKALKENAHHDLRPPT